MPGNKKEGVKEDLSLHLVGRIVEKGFSAEPSKETLSFPQPTVLPFPVARHRSDGPHWVPIGSVTDVDQENENEDEDDTDFNPISSFANPIKRKQKRGLDFSNWRELVREDGSTGTKENKKASLAKSQDVKGKREREESHDINKRNMLDPSTPSFDAFGPTEMKTESSMPPVSSTSIVGDPVASGPGATVVESDPHVGQGNLDSVPASHTIGDESKAWIAGRGSSESDQSLSLEGQIDTENRARLLQMSPDEIAEERAEIMEKLKPGLLEKLKKRGQNRLGKEKLLMSDLDAGHQLGSLDDATLLNQGSKSIPLPEQAKTSYGSRVMPVKDRQTGPDNGGINTLCTPKNNLWSSWSERVEAVRTLRFSFDGTVLGNLSDKMHSTDTGWYHPKVAEACGDGIIPGHGEHNADNVTQRDYLRTEGDPGATGYTIKEAVSLARSMIPAQRVLALKVLASVLDKALSNLRQTEVGYDIRDACKMDKFVDWQAVWAFSLGPEPDLALLLRRALDDNHVSVVLTSAKVIHCILSCDANEHYFNVSEKLATYQKGICTAPVFRSRPEIDLGFLHSGFWKYNTKPSGMLPLGDETVNDANEGERTIQDDINVAGQDFAAGLVRMAIVPRIHHLLETDPAEVLEQYLISILIGLGRHSPACANAIINCPKLVQTIVERFPQKDILKICPFKIKCVTLVKVLAQSDNKICLNFVEKGIFRNMMWHLYLPALPLDHWIKLGGEYCKLMSSLMVEQLRLWRVCINNGYCISYFPDFFPALCLWLSPPTFDKLIEKNLLGEFASISREAYLVLEALARKLPYLHSGEQLKMQPLESVDYDVETWSWSHVSPMVDLALQWISLKSSLYLLRINTLEKGTNNKSFAQDSSISCLLWVVSAVMHMLTSVLEKVVPEDVDSLDGSGVHMPWLPEFVPKIGLEIVKNRYLNFSGTNDMVLSEGGSLVKYLCHVMRHSDYELSLSSVCCLHGLVRLIVSVDKSIQGVKKGNCNPSSQGYSFSTEGKILEDGIVIWSQDELKNVLITSMDFVSSGWQYVQSVETFGRGGPAPGVGLGWGAYGGGFWSMIVLLRQTGTRLLMDLLEIFQIVLEKCGDEDMIFTAQRINSALGACLTAGPRDMVIIEKALDFLLQAPVLKYLSIFVSHHHKVGNKPYGCEFNEEDYLCFSQILKSHFRNRWLCVKRKSKTVNSNIDVSHKTMKNGGTALDTIHEESDKSNMSACDPRCASLVEWAHQRLPLPMHWFLSPISTMISRRAAVDLPNASGMQSHMSPANEEALELAKSGLFLLLGLEAMSPFLCTDIQSSPVHHVPLVWKLHSLSMLLLVGMSVLQEQKSRDMYTRLQDLYGKFLDESRCNRIITPCSENPLIETENKCGVEFLKFQSDIHESYSTFIETLVEQFGAVSYGDVISGRQIAIYLHSSVELPVRIATWNALSNAHILDLLPPLEKCYGGAEGYLNFEDNKGILEGYIKSWMSGELDKAAARGSITFTLALHHLSSFIFYKSADDNLLLRYKLAKSLLRDFSHKQQHQAMMLELIRYNKSTTTAITSDEMERRFTLLKEACEGNSSLLAQVEKLKSLVQRC